MRDLTTEAMVVVVDGELQPADSAAFATLPAGEHTIAVRIDATFPCGFLDHPRGRLVVRSARTYVVDAPRARVTVVLEELGATNAIERRVTTRWHRTGRGIAEADGCDFGPSVTVSGCGLQDPQPRRASPTREVRRGDGVAVLGEVRRPQTMASWAAPTLATAVCRAGGPTVFASRRAKVRRNNMVFMALRSETEDVDLEPGDVVFVEPICAGY